MLIVGTGNGAPWPAEIRSPGGGDHLYLSSIVALDLDTGEVRLALPDHAQRKLGLRQHIAAHHGGSDDRRPGSPRGHAGAEERLLLCAGCGERRAAVGRTRCAGVNWATRHRHEDRPADHESRRPTTTRRARARWSVRTSAARTTGMPMSFSPQTGLVYIPAMQSSYAFVATREDDNPMGQKLSISFAGNQEMMRKPKTHAREQGLPAGVGSGEAEGSLACSRGATAAAAARSPRRAGSCSRATPTTSSPPIAPIPASKAVASGYADRRHGRSRHVRSRWRAVRGGGGRLPPDRQLLRAELLAPAGVQARWRRQAAGRSAVSRARC